ncbi:sensor histidine kinase [Nonomuraea sp. NPDC050790]|uniref:sensor histidine kinase n=1 Tax=Nonomuraea sp. NPDC050790 TaxID=3364371 RepID=UPI00379C14CC
MERKRRGWVVQAVANVVTGVAALGLLVALPFAPRPILRAARRIGKVTEPDPGDLRVIAWLAAHGVVGPGSALVVWAMLSMLEVIMFDTTVVYPSPDLTVAFSLAMAAIVIVSALSAYTSVRVQDHLAKTLLGESYEARRIRELTASRAAAVDAQAAELRRIERDLHDGAQARLISMRMNLGLARKSTDPAQTRELVEEAWRSAAQALDDLRGLVRGIHPPVLADRGLTGAIQAAALLCPIPVELDLDLPGRPAAPVESALYFATAEALSNVAAHSGATHAWVRLRHAAGRIRLTVGDDGRGGADPGTGTGLLGIQRRLSAFDGTLTVTSPAGGPTELTMELPCASSSPKISPSSGTA